MRWYPDDYFAQSRLADSYRHLHRQGEAANALARVADLPPNDYRINADVAGDLRRFDLLRAHRYARRAIIPASEEGTGVATWSDYNYVFTIPFFDLWRSDAEVPSRN